MKKVLFYTASNVSSIVQYGGIGALEGSQECIATFRTSCRRGAISSTTASSEHAAGVLSGVPPKGAFYAFLRIDPAWRPSAAGDAGDRCRGRWPSTSSRAAASAASRASTSARNGEGYIRFCFARDRRELSGRARVDEPAWDWDGSNVGSRLRAQGSAGRAFRFAIARLGF